MGQVTSYKLLGVTIDASLKWADHIATVTSRQLSVSDFLRNSNAPVYLRQILVYY